MVWVVPLYWKEITIKTVKFLPWGKVKLSSIVKFGAVAPSEVSPDSEIVEGF